MTTASTTWRDELLAWALPDRITSRTPDRDPWRLRVDAFVEHADAATGTSPADRAARAALGDGGTVLDVGCGAGAAALGLGAAVTHATGVDERADMLDAFGDALGRRGIAHTEVVGRWPDVEGEVARADVVVCHHVVWNVPDLDRFLLALHDHAGRRVVLELTDRHPRIWTSPYWAALHDLDRPEGPTLDDLLAVMADAGLPEPEVAVTKRGPTTYADRDRRLAHLAEHLCLHDHELDALAAADDELWPTPHPDLATLWWGQPS